MAGSLPELKSSVTMVKVLLRKMCKQQIYRKGSKHSLKRQTFAKTKKFCFSGDIFILLNKCNKRKLLPAKFH